jgi:hypothetical protein
MRAFAADRRATGELRTDLPDDDIADIVWSMNGPEYWTLLVGDQGWSPERFGHHLADAWQRLFLPRAAKPPVTTGPSGQDAPNLRTAAADADR